MGQRVSAMELDRMDSDASAVSDSNFNDFTGDHSSCYTPPVYPSVSTTHIFQQPVTASAESSGSRRPLDGPADPQHAEQPSGTTTYTSTTTTGISPCVQASAGRSHIMRHFRYAHLSPHLQAISAPICEAANLMEATLPNGPEKSAGLRKLLEAKDGQQQISSLRSFSVDKPVISIRQEPGSGGLEAVRLASRALAQSGFAVRIVRPMFGGVDVVERKPVTLNIYPSGLDEGVIKSRCDHFETMTTSAGELDRLVLYRNGAVIAVYLREVIRGFDVAEEAAK